VSVRTDFDQRTLYAGDDKLIDLYDDESLPVVVVLARCRPVRSRAKH
jgi:hypothetical protein